MNRFFAPAILAGFLVAGVASADTFYNFDGPVTTGPTQAPGVWYTDRFAPATFESGIAHGGHSSTLHIGLAGSDFQGTGSFYNTQGRKIDLEAGTQSVSIDLFIDPAFDGASDRRITGPWVTGIDVNGDVSSYGILTLFDAAAGSNFFSGWDNATGYVNMGLPAGFAAGTWQTLTIDLLTSSDQLKYTIGNLSMLSSAFGTMSFTNFIANSHNTGANLDVYYDNLSTSLAPSGGAVPEPASWALMIVGFGFAGSVVRRRRLALAA
ncbi:MAG: hypothetical protein AB199_03555 [Parcubacteria bacterium C7867-004]|nr:MAG: hypothetical protein AB199_03555 [Parcubacteria bacterium C7867-004]